VLPDERSIPNTAVAIRPKPREVTSEGRAYRSAIEAIAILGDPDGFFREGHPVFDPVESLFDIGVGKNRVLLFLSRAGCFDPTKRIPRDVPDLHVWRPETQEWLEVFADAALSRWPIRTVRPIDTFGRTMEIEFETPSGDPATGRYRQWLESGCIPPFAPTFEPMRGGELPRLSDASG
jgi:hypothetical protein